MAESSRFCEWKSVACAARRAVVVLSALAVVGLGMFLTVGTASAASCGLIKNTTVTSGGFKAGEAHYTVDCSSGYVIVSGNVKDTKKDGKCIEAKVIADGSAYFFRACGSGNSKEIYVKRPGASASVYTYIVG